MGMLEETVLILAKKDSARHKLAIEMKKYIEHAKLISQQLENDELGMSLIPVDSGKSLFAVW